MAGHSHWAGIKHKKEIADQKRGRVFAKLLRIISVAAKNEPNSDYNPRLRTAIQKAKDASVPAEKIAAAIRHASDSAENIEEFLFEAYGPGGSALLIETASDNKNRTVAEIKKILREGSGKWAEAGGVRWAFERDARGVWRPKFPLTISKEDLRALEALRASLEAHDDVQAVHTNAI